MTESERLQRQLREANMRLREVRTENAELKIQYKRWLNMSAGVSVGSLLLTLVLLFFTGDVVIQMDQGHSSSPAPSSNQSFSISAAERDLTPEPTPPNTPSWSSTQEPEAIDAPALAVETPRLSPSTEEPEDSFEAPSLEGFDGFDGNAFEPNATSESSQNSSSNSPRRNAPLLLPSTSFSLPGVSNDGGPKVEQYTVKKNDNLWKIVKRFYGAATPQRIAKVMKDNGLSGSDITPGMTLLLIIDQD